VEAWLNAGCDAVGGRMLVAVRRGDALMLLHYAHRSLEAGAQLQALLQPGQPPAAAVPLGLVAALEAGLTDGAAARRAMVRAWRELLTEVRRRWPETPTGYAEAALRV
jgi:hypothetical protein